jgi:hypothetical protein
MRGTHGYLSHREGGRAALLRAKLAVGLPLALALALLPPLVACAWQLFGPDGALVLPARALEHALAGFVALPAYACGLFIALVAPNLLVALLLGLVAGFGFYLYSFWLPLPVFQMSALAPPLYVLGQALLASALLALSWRIFTRGHDRDDALSFRMQAGALVFALPLFVFPMSAITGEIVRSGQQDLFNGYPLIVRSRDGQYSLMERRVYEARTRDPQTETQTVRFPDGMVITEPNPSLVYNPAPPFEVPRRWRLGYLTLDPRKLTNTQRWMRLPVGRNASVAPELTDKDGRAIHAVAGIARAGSEAYDLTFLDREEGVVRQFIGLRTSARLRAVESPLEIVLRKSDGKSFSSETIWLTNGYSAALLADGVDRTLWMLDFADTGPRLAELSLPQGDRLVGIEQQQVWEPEGWTAELGGGYVLVGAQGRYLWTATGFVLEGSPLARPFWLRYCRSEWGESSLTSTTVRLRKTDDAGSVGPQSEVVITQRFEPRTGKDQLVAGLLRGLNLCGAPVLTVQRLVLGTSESLTRGFLPWLFMLPKDTRGMQFLHVVLGLLLGAWTWLRVARRGGERNERMLWSALVVLFGISALLFHVLLAPRPRLVAQPAPQPQSRKPAASLATA